VDFRIFTEPQQGASYEQLLAVARTAELAGFNGFFRSDHFLKMGSVDGLPGSTHAWLTLAALGRETSTIRLGTLVSPATFYRPGPLAIMVAQADEMSGGRIEFGFGTGWYEAEHSAYGLPFPPLGERFDVMEEYLAQVTGLWATPEGELFQHDGQFHQFADSPALPKPSQKPGPPIIIGGRGPKRTPALVAQYASEFNLPFVGLEDIRPALQRVDAACEARGRDPQEVVKSAALVLALGATEADVARRAAAIGREPEELRQNGLAGSPQEVIDKIRTYEEAGISRLYLQILDLDDLDHVLEAASSVTVAWN